MTERSFIDLETGKTASDNKIYPRAENARLQKLYETAQADQQANYPDLYVSSKEMSKQLEDSKAETAKVQGELTAKIEILMHKLRLRLDSAWKVRSMTFRRSCDDCGRLDMGLD